MTLDLSVDTAKEEAAVTETISPLKTATRAVLRRPLALISLVWITAVCIGSIFASVLSPHDPRTQDILHALAKPSGKYLLGTDDVGRDILSRLLHGGGTLMWSSAESVIVALLIGVPLGLLAGYSGGRFDSIASFAVNVVLAIPGFIILVAVVVVSGDRTWIVMGVLGILFSANLFRLVRATTQACRALPYVDTARVAGLSRTRILGRHVLPNVTGPLIVQAFLTFGVALIIATSLAFLGLGVSPEAPNWGQMIAVATQNLNTDPWMMVPVGFVVILTILSANFIGSAIRDALPHAQRQRLLVDSGGRRPARVAAESSSQQVETSMVDSPGSALLRVTDLTVAFPTDDGEQAVVDRVTFAVPKGRTLGLVGESGCGKTMTALSLLGLVPPPGRVSSGSIMLNDQELTVLSERERAVLRGSSIALVSQEPMVALDPCFSIGSLLREPLRHHGNLDKKAAHARALELLTLVGIARPEAVAKSYPHQISGGMAQRVGIALALAGEPDLLVADEPTTALDVTIQAEILDLLRELQERLGMTIVLVTHDLGVVADICTDVAVMYAGQIIEQGPVDVVLEHSQHPYTRGLLGAAPDLTAPGAPLPTVEGTVPLPKDWPSHCRFAARCSMAIDACLAGPIALTRTQPDHAARCIRSNEVAEEFAR